MKNSSAFPGYLPSPGSPLNGGADRRVFLVAAELLAESKGGPLDMDRLAARTRVTADALRNRFPTSDALVIATLNYVAYGLERGYLEASGGSSWPGLRAVADVVRALTAHTGLYEFYCQSLIDGMHPGHILHEWTRAHGEEFSNYVQGCVRAGIRLGEISSDADPKQIARTISALQFGVARVASATGEASDAANIVDGYLDQLERAYAAPR